MAPRPSNLLASRPSPARTASPLTDPLCDTQTLVHAGRRPTSAIDTYSHAPQATRRRCGWACAGFSRRCFISSSERAHERPSSMRSSNE